MMERNGDGFVIDNGLLRLERDGDSGNMIDRVLLGGKLLGGYQALLWQVGGEGELVRLLICYGRTNCRLCSVPSGRPDSSRQLR